MIKSTYKPSAAFLAANAPLPPGWTEHTAPTGHKYYYNASTKESTYTRPGQPPPPPAPVTVPAPYAALPNLSDPNVANAYLRQINQQSNPNPTSQRGGHGAGRGGRGGHDGRPKPQPVDKPRRTEPVPGFEPWILVYTKYSRRFAYNPVKNASYWRIPEKIMPGVLELDKARIRRAAGIKDEEKDEQPSGVAAPTKKPSGASGDAPQAAPDDDSDYEEVEVEVTDDEDADDQHLSKRQRTGEQASQDEHGQGGEEMDDGEEEEEEEEEEGDRAVEFTEADIAAQLAAMGEEYGLEPGDYDDGNMEEWPEGAEGVDFSEEDAKLLFKDLLNDLNVSPYSPWEKLLEDGKMIEDSRYTALTTTKARKECHDEWSREKIAALKEQRAKQEKTDPRVAYMAFLQDKATPKLYWPEFKRKYRKEEPMRDMKLSDKEREKAYREHTNRLKQPQSARKTALTTMLRTLPLHVLHNKSLSSDGLPTQVLIDPSYAALEPSVRDPLIEAYVQTLPGPPEDLEGAQADEEARGKRQKRERALEERNRAIDEQRRMRERDLAGAKARLREGEREVEVAMRVGKDGLRSQLVDGEGS